MARALPHGGASHSRSRYGEYAYLLERVGGWAMQDLDDLMFEIENDPAVSDAERKELLARLYALLWRRAQVRMPSRGATRPG